MGLRKRELGKSGLIVFPFTVKILLSLQMVTSIYTNDARYVKDIKMYQNEYCKCKQMVKTKFYISKS